MTKDKELKALFLLCQDLKGQVKLLTDKVETLSEARPTASGCCKHCKNIKAIQEEIENHIAFNAKEIATVNSELDQVNNNIEDIALRTDELEDNQTGQIKFNMMLQDKVAVQVDKLLELEVRIRKPQVPAQSFSVSRQKPPEFSRSDRRSRPTQVRWSPRPRVCYNCRKAGHLARNCHKPNPRLQDLSEPPIPPRLNSVLT